MLSTPNFLALGHVTRDAQPDGSFSIGGTVTYAALTAARLGMSPAIVTCADASFTLILAAELSGVTMHVRSSISTTTFANKYQNGFRTQYLYARADTLELEDVPPGLLSAPIVLFAPLAQELRPEFVMNYPRTPGMILAATPQGWLRRWDESGRVWPTLWEAAEQILPLLDVLILSHDDLLPFANHDRSAADEMLKHWSTLVPLLVATDGRHGATLFHKGQESNYPAYESEELDPTGAGDVFAAAFLTQLSQKNDPGQAVDFANCVASFSIEKPGVEGIPTLGMVEERLREGRFVE